MYFLIFKNVKTPVSQAAKLKVTGFFIFRKYIINIAENVDDNGEHRQIGNSKKEGDNKMRINSPRVKQIKKGVYDVVKGGTLKVGTYTYVLPTKTVVAPSQNIVIISNHRGDYVWYYNSVRSIWTIWKLSNKKQQTVTDIIQETNTRCFDFVVSTVEGNRALVYYPVFQNNEIKWKIKKEWRFFTNFFNDIVRQDKS